jgi:predicted nucleotidyltransferase
MELHGIKIPKDVIADFCGRHRIRTFALFGSILSGEFSDDSDIDVLVEFEPDQDPGLFAFAGMQMELSALLGREVHLHTPAMLPPRRRALIQDEARVQYAA